MSPTELAALPDHRAHAVGKLGIAHPVESDGGDRELALRRLPSRLVVDIQGQAIELGVADLELGGGAGRGSG